LSASVSGMRVGKTPEGNIFWKLSRVLDKSSMRALTFAQSSSPSQFWERL
jgi:hypothetical protein